ncbi:MAG TPA: hypothetical protein DEA22_13250 [Blastocatellia bacterium]|nr:hypothetical protein [Blastocatellia bacterium]
MEGILKGLIGRKVEVNGVSRATYCGELVSVSGGVAEIKDEDGRAIYLPLAAIEAFSEKADPTLRPGFIS